MGIAMNRNRCFEFKKDDKGMVQWCVLKNT